MPAPPQAGSRLFRRASWSLVDQGLSAASNLLLSVLVARTLDASGFGSFAVAFLTFGLMIALTRATIGQPLQISFSGAAPDDWHRAVRSAVAASVLVGSVAGVVLAAVALLLGGTTGEALLCVGVCMPGLLAQDTCRMAFFSSGRAKQAAFNDAGWTLLELGALAVLTAVGANHVGAFVLAWGLSATVAAVAACVVLRAAPHMRTSLRWMLDQRKLTGYLLAEHVLGEGLTQVCILLVGVVGTSADVGALRGGQVLLGPMNILATAVTIFGIPEVARRQHLSAKPLRTFCWVLSVVVSSTSVIYGALVLLLPEMWGRYLFGDTWAGAQSVLLPWCVLYIAVGLSVGPGIVLFGLGRARTAYRLNVLRAPILVAALSIGFWQGGVVGVAWGFATTQALLLPFVASRALAAIRDQVDQSLISDTADVAAREEAAEGDLTSPGRRS